MLLCKTKKLDEYILFSTEIGNNLVVCTSKRGTNVNKKKTLLHKIYLQKILNLSTCADSSTNTKNCNLEQTNVRSYALERHMKK